MDNGYYYARVKEVTVECYDPPEGVKQTGSGSYYYTSTSGLESDVVIGNKDMTLDSIYASGEKPDYDPNSDSGSDSGDKPQPTAQTVPGLSGAGNQAIEGNNNGNNGGDAPDTGATALGDGTGGTSFVQGDSSSEASTVIAGSAVALLGFFVAALML